MTLSRKVAKGLFSAFADADAFAFVGFLTFAYVSFRSFIFRFRLRLHFRESGVNFGESRRKLK